jgi:predicted MPP superfamily phosphohydrolase
MKKRMLFIPIFILMIASFALAHWVTYASIVNFFQIQSQFSKNIIIGFLVFLALSFFVSTALSHMHDDIFTRAYYFFSGLWIGFMINLLVFFSLVWIIVLINSKFHFFEKGQILGFVAILLAFLCSMYGVWNAFNPIVKNVDVNIKNLPKEWVGKKIIQISDVHLGHVYRKEGFSKIVEKINNLKPDVVVITGDLFDGTDGNLEVFAEPLGKLKAKDGVYFITGNHETYLGVENAEAVLKKTNILWIRDSLIDINGLQFIGIDYPLRGSNRDIRGIVSSMPNYFKNKPSVLLIHEPLQVANAKELGISLQLSGHTHLGQLFPFRLITGVIFGKYDYGFHNEGDYNIYTSSGLGGWGPPMRTESRSEIVEIVLN